ncbi:MAG TPA: MOSC domain-containing protein [Pyrinomonadaceae bacterium]|nr:MOSC domain-containing protein [Pyrinomonadaceae bacterium]
MNLISLNVGRPRLVNWQGQTVSTGIFKEPVAGPVTLRTLNLDGDRQADLTVHGGKTKAVYAYPFEHYAFWKSELPDMELPYGMFGENFTTSGLLEDNVHIGDRFRVGTAELMATEPRMPCYKLGLKFGRTDIIRRFLQSRRTGFYFAVLQEGEVRTGDSIERLSENQQQVTIADITRLYAFDKGNVELLKRAVAAEALPQSWREYFQKQIEKHI